MRSRITILALTILTLTPAVVHAQHAITGATTKLDFNTYTGAGLQPVPAAGQLDSMSGWSPGCRTT